MFTRPDGAAIALRQIGIVSMTFSTPCKVSTFIHVNSKHFPANILFDLLTVAATVTPAIAACIAWCNPKLAMKSTGECR
ncbi:MAG: hypothetical protein R3E64_17525 [Halioglobus sp.]